jgi:hypothetical protein
MTLCCIVQTYKRIPLVEQEPLTILEHLGSPAMLSGVPVT